MSASLVPVRSAAYRRLEEMIAEFGGPEEWQLATIERWVTKLAALPGLSVLDGQVRLSWARDAFARHHVDGHIVLIDCSHSVREARLRLERGQPELATPAMATWASYLRGQADAMGVPVIDTTLMDVEAAADLLHVCVAALAAV